MKKKGSQFLFLICSGVFILSSCHQSCNCTKNLGCGVAIATDPLTLQVTERKLYCSDQNYYPDAVHADSLKAFKSRHLNDNSRVELRDSLYYMQNTDNLSEKETQYYEDLGYTCNCAK